MRFTLFSLCLVGATLIAGCDRVVTFEPEPEAFLPSGYEVTGTLSYTPSGRGTEYQTTFWLVEAPEGIGADDALATLENHFQTMGYEDLGRPPDASWPSIRLQRPFEGIELATLDDFTIAQRMFDDTQIDQFASEGAFSSRAAFVVALSPLAD